MVEGHKLIGSSLLPPASSPIAEPDLSDGGEQKRKKREGGHKTYSNVSMKEKEKGKNTDNIVIFE